MEYFKIAHLFTQWGAYHASKIMAEENGHLKRVFGWETDAHGATYKNFHSQFLPVLVTYIKNNELDKSVYFHISDEPKQHNIDSYRQASETIQPYVADFPVIDALSDYNFYEQGLVKKPIPTTVGIEPFLGSSVPDL